jgi:hypothetical protein
MYGHSDVADILHKASVRGYLDIELWPLTISFEVRDRVKLIVMELEGVS